MKIFIILSFFSCVFCEERLVERLLKKKMCTCSNWRISKMDNLKLDISKMDISNMDISNISYSDDNSNTTSHFFIKCHNNNAWRKIVVNEGNQSSTIDTIEELNNIDYSNFLDMNCKENLGEISNLNITELRVRWGSFYFREQLKISSEIVRLFRNVKHFSMYGSVFEKITTDLVQIFPILETFSWENNTGLDNNTFDAKFFYNNPKLRHVTITNSELETNQLPVFPSQVKFLNLSGNKITKMPQLGQNLISLNLRKNSLSEINETNFENLTSLEEIDLSENPLKRLKNKNIFLKNENLKIFRMEADICTNSNSTRQFPEGLFLANRYLTQFYYSVNKTCKQFDIPSNLFQNQNGSLKQVRISGTDLDWGAIYSVIKNLYNLEFLDVSHNNITNINLEDISENLKTLILDGNKFYCDDCKSLESIESNFAVIQNYAFLNCTYKHDSTTDFTIIETFSVNCSYGKMITYILSGLTTLMIVTGILVFKVVRKREFTKFISKLKGVMESDPYNDPSLADSKEIFNDGNLIGQGGFGEVYKEFYKGEIVAFKRLTIKASNNKISKEDFFSFIGEVQAIKGKEHENLLSLIGYSFSTENLEQAIIIFPFMPNGSLHDKLSTLTWAERGKIALGVSKGLQFIHSFNMIHGDIKPTNILLDMQNEPKICDFGLASWSKFTRKDRLCGTLNYLPPEYIKKGIRTSAVDTYAFGITLFEMVNLDMQNFLSKHMMLATDKLILDQKVDAPIFPWHICLFTTAKICTKKNPLLRPTMQCVSNSLELVESAYNNNYMGHDNFNFQRMTSNIHSLYQERVWRYSSTNINQPIFQIQTTEKKQPRISSHKKQFGDDVLAVIMTPESDSSSLEQISNDTSLSCLGTMTSSEESNRSWAKFFKKSINSLSLKVGF